MTEKLRAHDFTRGESVRPLRRWRKPWHVRVLLALFNFPTAVRGWWTGNSLRGITPLNPMEHIKIYAHGRQALWQLVRLPMSLVIFLYVICCVVAGHAATLTMFRAFIAHVFNCSLNGGS